jgi:hypothetical protein
VRDQVAEHKENNFAALKQAMLDQFYAAKEIGRKVGSRLGWDALHMTKNIGGMMSTVFKTAPMEVYDDPYAGRWVRRRKDWTDGGFEATLEGLADKGELRRPTMADDARRFPSVGAKFGQRCERCARAP